MKKYDLQKKSNNSSIIQYSHHHARLHYSKKKPHNLRKLIVEFLINKYNKHQFDYHLRSTTSAENIAMHFGILHKFIVQEFMKMQQEGLIKLLRDSNNFAKSKPRIFNEKTEYFNMPIMWDEYYSRWFMRVPKNWVVTQQFKNKYIQNA